MTYSDLVKKAKAGKIGMLPNFVGYFKWDYGKNNLIFQNGDFICNAENLDILNRQDFYYII